MRTQNEKTVWFVVYDDGDEEEVERAEIENILMATQKSKQHIRGHFVTSKDQLNLHDKVWIAFENEVVGLLKHCTISCIVVCSRYSGGFKQRILQ